MPAAVMPPPSIARAGAPTLRDQPDTLSSDHRLRDPSSPTFAYPLPSPLPEDDLSGQPHASSSSQLSPTSPTQQAAARPGRHRPDTEEIKRVGRIHYQELFAFLRSHLAKDQTGPRSNAREKLTRLSKQQFTELSTDVYDELIRRVQNSKDPSSMPHLAVRDEFHPKRNQARQKLSTLPKTRFKDLSSDVFFELERRYPEFKEEFRPDAILREQEAARRRQIEQAEAEAEAQAANLASSTAAEAAATPSDSQAQRQGSHSAMAAQESTSNVIIPAKSTLVEEDISVPYKNGRSSANNFEGNSSEYHGEEVADNRSTRYSQASSVGTGFFNGYAGSRAAGTESVASPNLGARSSQMEGPGTFGIEKLRSDYEFRIATLNQRITSLENQNNELKASASRSDEHEQGLREAKAEGERLRTEHSEQLRSVREDLSYHRQQHEEKSKELKEANERMQSLHGELDQALMNSGTGEDAEKLQEELAQQGQIVQELRAEVESLVQEISQLSARNEELVGEKDQDLLVISDLNQQVQSFKRRYEQAKAELRQYKASSQLYVAQSKADEFLVPTDKGAIADVNVSAFQTSIDELLVAARSTTPSSVIVAMKSVVLATTLLTDDVAKHEQSSAAPLSSSEAEQLDQLKPRISTSLNNLMTACRNHAASQGVSPISLIDAAASHVSTTVVDLVKLVKVRAATIAEKEQFEAHFCGNSLPPGGLKPLHIASSGGGGARSASLAPISPIEQSAEFKSMGGAAAANAQPPQDMVRLSPRAAKSAANANFVLGRYSPVGYRPTVNRTDSTGDWASKAGRGRAMSGSSATSSSANGGIAPAGTPFGGSSSDVPVPALPRTDLSTIKHQWGQNSPPRRSISGTSSLRAGTGRVSGVSSIDRHDSSGSFDAPPSSSSLLAAAAGQHAPPSLGEDNSEENWAELRNYIEVQTEAIVHSIQALLSAIREGAQGVQLNENLVQITTIASSIVAISRENLPDSSRQDGEAILLDLQENCDRLSEMQTRPQFDKTAKSAMASASYGVAKGLKALNGLLNAVDVASPVSPNGEIAHRRGNVRSDAGQSQTSSDAGHPRQYRGEDDYSDLR
ncbi:unnamed protein product [Parajaminaea phylloscopi]